jgi:hypothetical protein
MEREPKKKNHTELPWHVYEGGNFVRIVARGYEEFVERKHYLGGPLCVASLHYNATVNYESDHDQAMVNAEFIIRAVNNHDALVEALGLLAVTAADGSGKCWCVADPRVFGHRDECVQVRTALAAAKE